MTVRIFTIGNNIKNKGFPLISDRFSVKIFIKPAKRDNSMNTRIPLEVSAKGINKSNE